MEARDRPPGGPARRELHEEDRQPDQREREKVERDEPAAAVLSGDVGKAPGVAEADRAPGGQEDEAQSARQFLSHNGNLRASMPCLPAMGRLPKVAVVSVLKRRRHVLFFHLNG